MTEQLDRRRGLFISRIYLLAERDPREPRWMAAHVTMTRPQLVKVKRVLFSASVARHVDSTQARV